MFKVWGSRSRCAISTGISSKASHKSQEIAGRAQEGIGSAFKHTINTRCSRAVLLLLTLLHVKTWGSDHLIAGQPDEQDFGVGACSMSGRCFGCSPDPLFINKCLRSESSRARSSAKPGRSSTFRSLVRYAHTVEVGGATLLSNFQVCNLLLNPCYFHLSSRFFESDPISRLSQSKFFQGARDGKVPTMQWILGSLPVAFERSP